MESYVTWGDLIQLTIAAAGVGTFIIALLTYLRNKRK